MTHGHNSYNCSIHLERTLDEAYHPGLSSEALGKRNRDQIVSFSGKNFDNYNKEEDDPDAPIQYPNSGSGGSV